MGLQRNSVSQGVVVNFGLVLVAALIFVSMAEQSASAHVIPQYSGEEGDGDARMIEIMRRSDANGEGMQDALKYLEELDKYYAQVARPR